MGWSAMIRECRLKSLYLFICRIRFGCSLLEVSLNLGLQTSRAEPERRESGGRWLAVRVWGSQEKRVSDFAVIHTKNQGNQVTVHLSEAVA